VSKVYIWRRTLAVEDNILARLPRGMFVGPSTGKGIETRVKLQLLWLSI